MEPREFVPPKELKTDKKVDDSVTNLHGCMITPMMHKITDPRRVVIYLGNKPAQSIPAGTTLPIRLFWQETRESVNEFRRHEDLLAAYHDQRDEQGYTSEKCGRSASGIVMFLLEIDQQDEWVPLNHSVLSMNSVGSKYPENCCQETENRCSK